MGEIIEYNYYKMIDRYSFENNDDHVLGVVMKLNCFIGIKDLYTKMHSDHVSYYAVLLGNELNLSQRQLELLKIGGQLHDIGKIAIPDSILKKDSALDEEEFEVMKRHTIIGDAILSNTCYKEIKEIVRSHHERLDGTGYPDGLKGEEIPYFARIISVVDTFDAMTTQRTYNELKTLEEAIVELRKIAKLELNDIGEFSQHLDPDLVELFIKAIYKNSSLIEGFKKRDAEIINFRNQKKLNKSFSFLGNK